MRPASPITVAGPRRIPTGFPSPPTLNGWIVPRRRHAPIAICSGVYRPLFMPAAFVATLVEGEAVLRFPYDDRLRLSLRAIPGRRWDPEARVWRVPLDPDRAHALSALLESGAVSGRGLRCARPRARAPIAPSARPLSCWSISPGPTATGGSASRPTARRTWSRFCSSIRTPTASRRSSEGCCPSISRPRRFCARARSTTQGCASPTMPGTP